MPKWKKKAKKYIGEGNGRSRDFPMAKCSHLKEKGKQMLMLLIAVFIRVSSCVSSRSESNLDRFKSAGKHFSKFCPKSSRRILIENSESETKSISPVG